MSRREWMRRNTASVDALDRLRKSGKTTLRQTVRKSGLFACPTCGRLACGNHVAAEFGDGTFSAGGWMHFCNESCVSKWAKELAKFDKAKP